ncbi:hypothetical protein ACLMJK_001972 [Lecanora helva]
MAVALTDFQKAQCFFMLAINIAAQAVVRQGGLEPRSLQQMYDTYSFIRVLAINGFLPITFTLFTLHLIDMVSWYLIILSGSSIALSSATLLTIGNFDPTPANLIDLASAYSTGGPDTCGNVSLDVLCYDQYDYGLNLNADVIGFTAPGMSALSIIVFVLLIIDKAGIARCSITRLCIERLSASLKLGFGRIRKISSNVWRNPPCGRIMSFSLLKSKYHNLPMPSSVSRWKHPYRYFNGKDSFMADGYTYWTSKVKNFQSVNYTAIMKRSIIIAIYLTFSGLYITCFVYFCRDLAVFASNGSYSKTWNFGQVVAITVWAPPLFEYIHLELRGMKRGFDHKLLPPYRITKNEDMNITEAKGDDSYENPSAKGSDNKMKSGESGSLLQPYKIAEAKDPGVAPYDDNVDHPMRARTLKAVNRSTRYDAHDDSEPRWSVRTSQDALAWTLPPTKLPEGGLSPF